MGKWSHKLNGRKIDCIDDLEEVTDIIRMPKIKDIQKISRYHGPQCINFVRRLPYADNVHCEPKKTWQRICDHNSGKP